MTSSELIEQIMKNNNLSQLELAAILGTTQPTISRLLRGKYKISAAMRHDIVDEFNYSFEYTFREVD